MNSQFIQFGCHRRLAAGAMPCYVLGSNIMDFLEKLRVLHDLELIATL